MVRRHAPGGAEGADDRSDTDAVAPLRGGGSWFASVRAGTEEKHSAGPAGSGDLAACIRQPARWLRGTANHGVVDAQNPSARPGPQSPTRLPSLIAAVHASFLYPSLSLACWLSLSLSLSLPPSRARSLRHPPRKPLQRPRPVAIGLLGNIPPSVEPKARSQD